MRDEGEVGKHTCPEECVRIEQFRQTQIHKGYLRSQGKFYKQQRRFYRNFYLISFLHWFESCSYFLFRIINHNNLLCLILYLFPLDLEKKNTFIVTNITRIYSLQVDWLVLSECQLWICGVELFPWFALLHAAYMFIHCHFSRIWQCCCSVAMKI